MKEKAIESFVDCGVHIVYSSPEEFLEWAKEHDVKINEDLMRIAVGMSHKFLQDGEEKIQYVWINSAAGRSFDKLISEDLKSNDNRQTCTEE